MLTGPKPIHYYIGFDPGLDGQLNFNVNCICILNIERKDCSKYSSTEDNRCRIRHREQIKLIAKKPVEVIRTVWFTKTSDKMSLWRKNIISAKPQDDE